MKTKEYIRACPKCDSINVKTDFSNPVVWSSGANPQFQCKACGHLGIIFPELLKDELAKFRSKLKQKREKLKEKEMPVDVKTGYRVGMFRIIIFIAAAIIVLGIGLIYALLF